MKPKVHYHVQPREIVSPCNEQVQQEIQNFFQAVDSYPARAVKEPRISFQQHLCSIFAGRSDDERRDTRSRRQ
jgi:hypothetical protein